PGAAASSPSICRARNRHRAVTAASYVLRAPPLASRATGALLGPPAAATESAREANWTCKSVLLLGAAAAISALAGAGAAEARDQIRIVGSSTVLPFATAVAEQFGKTTKFKTPVVESTGTGGGLKLFCVGLGVRHPDIANASRR